MINFDTLPAGKPNGGGATAPAPGRYKAVIDKAEMKTSNGGRTYLSVMFKTKDAGNVFENYFDGDKPFLMYKISRLLKATGVILEGTGTLEDIAKLIKNKKVLIDTSVDDKGYGILDYTDNKEGVYARDEAVAEETPQLDEEVKQVIASDDDDF